ncbi:glutamate 5-kinase [Acetitomaculum ruminis DSM 5522]|uniref:Glutamate 5-kinase n=1 Tax=Acetitomaculum ruminis DSM 5522 TaxID=1120918 RepID=A0A1I0X9C2_9FIRM|nr:glutamate 5-kinase [Acetitomaculum ruminis]SFA97679.1 glutamate 5-kinase [Acetitomaculum ruminis DSM 5522]
MDNIKNRIVVKVGTSTITTEEGFVDIRAIDKLARVLSAIHNCGWEVILVSSGAIAVGLNKMRIKERPKEMKMKQAAAAVGQLELMHIYDKFFSEYGKLVAQILFTEDDIHQEYKRKNLTNTFNTLLENNIIPIVNENDSISYTEIESEKKIFSDNDALSAVVAHFCNASKLVLLSDIDGLYNGDPRKDPNAILIGRIDKIDDSIRNLASGAGTTRGTGGMVSKLDAAEIATKYNIDMYITNGRKPENIYDIIDDKFIGTVFTGNQGV